MIEQASGTLLLTAGPQSVQGALSMSMADVEKVAQKIKGLLVDGDRKGKRFGIGGPSEQSCESFRAFLWCQGVFNQRKAVDLPPGSTLEDARVKFGRPMCQQKICDEDGYELEPSSPVWKYSKDCNISLMFQYDSKLDAAKCLFEHARNTFALGSNCS